MKTELKRFGTPTVGSVGYQSGDHKIIVQATNNWLNNKMYYEIRSYSAAHGAWVYERQIAAKNYITAAREYFGQNDY